MSYPKYLLLRWAPVLLAFPITVALCVMAPRGAIAVFDLNTALFGQVGAGVGMLGEMFVAPHLPTGVWTALTTTVNGIGQLYNGLVMTIHTVAENTPSSTGVEIEAIARAYLAEGWLLLAEVACIIRYLLAQVLQGRSQ